jgi:hypothetical protein
MTTSPGRRRLARRVLAVVAVALLLGACAEVPSAPSAGKPVPAKADAAKGGRRGGYNVVAD